MNTYIVAYTTELDGDRAVVIALQAENEKRALLKAADELEDWEFPDGYTDIRITLLPPTFNKPITVHSFSR